MSSKKGLGDHIYLFTETSGDSLDTGSVGGIDLERANDYGTPTLTATGIQFDGVNDKGLFPATASPFTTVGSGVDMTNDFSAFAVVEFLSSPAGIATGVIGTDAASAGFCQVGLDDVNANSPKMTGSISGGTSVASENWAAFVTTGTKYYIGWSIKDKRQNIFILSENGTTLFHYKHADGNAAYPKNYGHQVNGQTTSAGWHSEWTRLETFKSYAMTSGEHEQTARDIFSLSAKTATPTQEERDPTDWAVDNGTPVFINDEVNTLVGQEKMLDEEASTTALLSKSGFGAAASSGTGHTYIFRYKHGSSYGASTTVALAQYDNDGIKARNFQFTDDISGTTRQSMTWFTPAASGSSTAWVQAQFVADQEYIVAMVDDGHVWFDAAEVQYFTAWPSGGAYTGIGALDQEDVTLSGNKNATNGEGQSGISLLEYHDSALTPAQIQVRYDALNAEVGTNPDSINPPSTVSFLPPILTNSITTGVVSKIIN